MSKGFKTAVCIRGKTLEWAVFRQGPEGPAAVSTGCLEPDLGDQPSVAAWMKEKPDEAAAAVRKAGLRPRGQVTLSIPSALSLLRVAELPSIDADELASMVDIQVDKFSPFPADSVAASFDVLQAGDATSRVLIAAVHKGMVEAIGAVFRRAGILLHRVDVAVLGWWGALLRGGAAGVAGRRILIAASGDGCDIMIVDAGIPVMFRSIAPAPGMTPEEFEADAAYEAAYTLTSLPVELGDMAVTGITVWSDETAPRNLAAQIGKAGTWPVTEEPLAALGTPPEAIARREDGHPGHLLDLSLPEWHEAEKARLMRHRLLGASIGILSVWALGAAGTLIGAKIDSARLERIRRESERLQGPAMEVRSTRARVMALALHTDAGRSALECLREVTILLPEGVDLTSFIYRKGKTVNLQGEAGAVAPIVEFKNGIDTSPLFARSELQGPVRVRSRETFKMTITLPEGAP